MSQDKQFILVVEDDLDVADMLGAYFNVQGYEVQIANWGEDAVKSCLQNPPDLVILDIRLPDIDGYEVARRLRSNRRTKEVPIIFLTEKRARSDRLQGLQLGADDYMTKPFDVQELRLRVRNALERSIQGSLTNPVTNLPEGTLVDERLKECLTSDGWALVRISLTNLDAFRESYGFVASDDVLRAVHLMINNAVRDIGKANDFIGQLGPADFVLVTTPDVVHPLSERVIGRLEQSVDYFYPIKDRGRKELKDRYLGVNVGQVFSEQGPFNSIGDIKTALA